VFDDRSSDDSPEIAREFGTLVVRDEGSPSFLEHEGQFRQDGWRAFEEYMKPEIGDWVLAFDADEFLVHKNQRKVLEEFTKNNGGFVSLQIPFVEVFDVDLSGNPSYRVDGFWGTIKAPRFFAYKPGGKFQQVPMGCGSVPIYVLNTSTGTRANDLVFLHYGYAVFSDRVDKHDRYSTYPSGHNSRHIQSILEKPSLRPWTGLRPDFTR